MKLNKFQEKAVKTTQGRVLVLAGAGSGKTRVIVHRIAHLIEIGTDPLFILGLTFTNKAAEEMRSRLEKLIGPKISKQVALCTFHSFCMQILRKEIEHLGYTRNFSLYDERDIHRLIQQISREMLGIQGELPSLSATKTALQEAQNQGFKESNWHDAFAKDLFFRMKSTLRAYNAVSFDTLITLSIQLFEEHPQVLDLYQERFRYLMIDEVQDTNPAQFRLAELLSQKYGNLCVVGDDDQSIYGWRGAEVKNILHFKADHTIKLEQNYRSSPLILEAANALIRHNQNRHDKKLWSESKNAEPLEIFHAPNDAIEAESVIHRLIRLHNHGMKWGEMAVLYRSNSLSRQFEVGLINASWNKEGKWVRGIPYEVFGGLEFTQRSEIKDLFAYLRLVVNPLDQEALLRIINVPRRGISDAFLDKITQENRSQKIPLWTLLEAQEKPQVKNFVDLIRQAQDRFRRLPLSEALLWLIEKINYKKAIEEEVKSEKMRQFKWENVQECVNALAQETDLQEFISNAALNQKIVHKTSKIDQVHLMTLHSAKGLEFPAVFIIGLEDGILPHEKNSSLEEERRLFYVGITRAQKHLTLSMARSRMRMGKIEPTNPSRFLHEIPSSFLNAVDHKVFL